MAAPTNTATTITTVGQREDLENMIYRISPEETPFQNAVKKGKAKAIKHDWQTEALAAPNAENAQLEGDDIATVDAPNNTVRLEGICQIFRKSGSVSGTADAVDVAGRDDEMDRQKLLKGLEIKRDQEAAFLQNRGSQAESGSNPRKTAGALAWCVTNTSKGTGGADGGYAAGVVTAATDGTRRTFTETLLKGAMASAFSNGGKPKQLYMPPTLKQEASAFTGIAQYRKDVKGNNQVTIVAGADIYASDFGELAMIAHPYGLTRADTTQRDVLGIDPEYWSVDTLRGYGTQPLAKSGDSDKFLGVTEKCLASLNEKSSFAIRDLQ